MPSPSFPDRLVLMLFNNFHVVAFVLVPTSVIILFASVMTAAKPELAGRKSLWWGVATSVYLSLSFGWAAVSAFAQVSASHGALLLFFIANLWASTMLSVAALLRIETEHRRSRSTPTPVQTGAMRLS